MIRRLIAGVWLILLAGPVGGAELEAGASEWSIWVKPAMTSERIETVLILRRAVNPDRIVAGDSTTKSTKKETTTKGTKSTKEEKQ